LGTLESFDNYLSTCRKIFTDKHQDYGASWRVLRPSSLTDQILIKISRLRSIDEKGEQKVNDPLEGEFFGLINYSIMALIQLSEGTAMDDTISVEDLVTLYDKQADVARKLLGQKNHDYGEVWRMMRLSSIIDIILMKVHRMKKIEEQNGKTLISEGLDANYLDIINYCVFGLVKLEEKK